MAKKYKKMKLFEKPIFNYGVDLIFGLVMLALFIWYLIDQSKNFTGALIVVFAYVLVNIINKIQIVKYLKKYE